MQTMVDRTDDAAFLTPESPKVLTYSTKARERGGSARRSPVRDRTCMEKNRGKTR